MRREQTRLRQLLIFCPVFAYSCLLSACGGLLPTLPDVTAGFDAVPRPDMRTVEFTSTTTSEAGILRETWNYGDGTPDETIEASRPVTHEYAAPGEYLVSLTAVDNNFRESQATKFVRVGTPEPTAFFTVSVGGTEVERISVPPSIRVDFDASGSLDPDGGILTYRWNFGDGTAEQQRITPTIDHTYTRDDLVSALDGLEAGGEPVELRVTLTVTTTTNAVDTFVRTIFVELAQ